MSSRKSWRPLPLTSPDLPALLVSMHVDPAAYAVQVTDMANVWSESLDRKAICIRGWSENTSIDPSDTPDNMVKFLTNLETALNPSQQGHGETHLHLTPASESDAGVNGLTLKITCDLPGLQPLKWPMHLKKSPQSAIATDFVLPLIKAHLTKSLEVDSLIHILGQKDAAMTKLLDKLESIGTGLEHIFNPLSGKKKVSRSAAAEKVPGLSPFNRPRWKTGLAEAYDEPNNPTSLVTQVFGGEGLSSEVITTMDSSTRLDSWWRGFSGATSVSQQSQTRPISSSSKSRKPEVAIGTEEEEDDDFQVQPTPPHLSSRNAAETEIKPAPNRSFVEDEAESTASETDVPTALEMQSPRVKQNTRLGTLGRKKQPPPTRSHHLTVSQQVKPSSQEPDESETASEAEEDENGVTNSLPDDASPPRCSSKPSPKKGGLGRIGGPKPKPLAEGRTRTPEPETIDLSSQPVVHRIPKKLGVIGKKREGSAGPSASTNVSRGRSKEPKKEEAKMRETSQERADRKRAELKRELEKKAAAGPAKKKRKF